MKKLIISIAIVLMSAVGFTAMVPVQDVAAESAVTCQTHFLGLKVWYDGLTDGNCNIQGPVKDSTGASLRRFVWTIVMNVVSMVLGVVGYLAILMVIWGGYQYMMAQGDAGKLAKGKKTVTNAVVGLAIVMSASIISGAVADVISQSKGGDFIQGIFNTAFVWGGIIAVIMMIWGGIQYVTSTGDPSAAKKGRDTILYAAVGLLIVILGAVIVNTVVGVMQ
ncbi:hypothetical protein IK110_03035 [Candidatus Saccharibacteria bacterium]|nr:hypothetical protein [Candidatus Saccharibacteria bacterium]